MPSLRSATAVGPVALHVAGLLVATVVLFLLTPACGQSRTALPHTDMQPQPVQPQPNTPQPNTPNDPLLAAPPGAPAAKVVDIIDGDTIKVDLGSNTEIIRLLGIDTPEKAGGPRPAECHGAEASAFIAQLLPLGSTVRLARDIETRDQYGRLLAYVFRESDGLFVNHALVDTGHATAKFYEPNTAIRTQLTRAALAAERDQLGFWAHCGGADVLLPGD